MCGIAGMYRYGNSSDELDESVGLRMVEALVHRGPDDGGLLVAPNILLGHRRLSILDLSDDGHQPMSDEDERSWIVFNGEIYNYRELRKELQAEGHCFRSRTDTEVILRGYLEWGIDVLPRLNGMFAFALWDARDEQLWLVRDPIGIKPLYYHDDGTNLRFGSEIKAILADEAVGRRPDWRGLDNYLTFGYSAAPGTCFEGVRQLLPGEWLRVGPEGIVSRKWYSLPYSEGASNWTIAESAERLETAFDAAVERQMVSDVPLGALLSGGLDSTTVVRSIKRRRSSLDTFTIGFDDASFDESPLAARVAELFRTRHRSQELAADAAAVLPLIVAHTDEPFADNSAIPFYFLSEFVRQHVTVALSGDGADELLAGYDTYRASQMAEYYRLLPAMIRRTVITPLVQRLPASEKKYGWPMLLRRFVAGAEHLPLRDHCNWRRIVPAEMHGALYSDRFKILADGDPIGEYAGMAGDAPPWLTPLERQMHADLRFHLPNDMLVKVDRMSMAHALEVRVPFLDLEVVKTCLAIPPACKRQGKRGKLVLKKMLERDVPRDLIERRKAGFIVPLERWLRSDWAPLVREFLTERFAAESGLFAWPKIETMIRRHQTGASDHAYALYALLVLAIWWRMWMTDEPLPTIRRPAARATRIHRLRERCPAE